jgi:hypothetical protein
LSYLLPEPKLSAAPTSFFLLNLGSMVGALDPEVDPLVEKGDKPVGVLFQKDLDSRRVLLMVEENDGFADEGHWSLIETAVEGYSPVLFHLAHRPLAEEVLQLRRGRPQTRQMRREPFQGGLPGYGMGFLVIFLKPMGKRLI